MPNMRMAPGDNCLNPMTIPGTSRKYTCAVGSVIDVPDFDADQLANSGWIKTVRGGVGPTSGRPIAPLLRTHYVDTTLGAVIIYAGSKTGWINAVTGAQV